MSLRAEGEAIQLFSHPLPDDGRGQNFLTNYVVSLEIRVRVKIKKTFVILSTESEGADIIRFFAPHRMTVKYKCFVFAFILIMYISFSLLRRKEKETYQRKRNTLTV